MKSKYLMIGIIVLLLAVVFSGCNEQINSRTGLEKTDKVQLVSYSTWTEKYIDFTTGYQKIADGFVYSEDADRYVVNATIKNIAGEKLDTILVDVGFYDSSNNLLKTTTKYVWGLPNSYTENVEVTYSSSSTYFENVDHVSFEFYIT
jgi:hypothetical protein